MEGKKSQEELEKPAKVYQMDALHTEIVAVKKLLEDQNNYIKGTASIDYVDGRIISLDNKIEAKLELMRSKYDPVLGNARWVTRTAIFTFITIAVSLVVASLKR
jgi:hypothetical protein